MYYILEHDGHRGVVRPIDTAVTRAEAEIKVRDMRSGFYLEQSAWEIAVAFDGLDDGRKDFVLDLLTALRDQQTRHGDGDSRPRLTGVDRAQTVWPREDDGWEYDG
jgi:hypothetical protein